MKVKSEPKEESEVCVVKLLEEIYSMLLAATNIGRCFYGLLKFTRTRSDVTGFQFCGENHRTPDFVTHCDFNIIQNTCLSYITLITLLSFHLLFFGEKY